MYRNLSEFIARLEREGELQRVSVPVVCRFLVG
jgi:3-polyprenyl-4-hydroxybenzoate decarboxylase